MAAVEHAFKLYAEGKAAPPKVLGIHADNGGFHIKAGMMNLGKNFFVAKSNANFPQNPEAYGLPSIQGVIIVGDGENGRLLALLDSIEITILRTGAATGVAAKYLSKTGASVATIIGCGNQGAISLRALKMVRPLEKAFVFDIDPAKSKQFADYLSQELKITIEAVSDIRSPLQQSDICVTCTSSKKPFLKPEYIKKGTFIAAVGADNEDKQELFPELLASNRVVTDITEQCASIGELHHAIDSELMIRFEVHAELGEVIAGQKPGRMSDDEIIIFDSTGTALQDVAATAIVYEKALKSGVGMKFNFAKQENRDGIAEKLRDNQKAIAALSAFFPFR
jgi:ornithine cyclodeaminase/alanine dehydrogenase-like protein (mu-crystallin family)